MPRINLPSIDPQTPHFMVGDETACGINLRENPDVKAFVTEWLATCKECRAVLKGEKKWPKTQNQSL